MNPLAPIIEIKTLWKLRRFAQLKPKKVRAFANFLPKVPAAGNWHYLLVSRSIPEAGNSRLTGSYFFIRLRATKMDFKTLAKLGKNRK